VSKRITENTASPKLVDNYVDEAKYNELYKESVENNEAFWAKEAQRVKIYTLIGLPTVSLMCALTV